MKKVNYEKIKLFSKSIWNGVLGISHEVGLALLFIAIGFIVCLLWWIIFR